MCVCICTVHILSVCIHKLYMFLLHFMCYFKHSLCLCVCVCAHLCMFKGEGKTIFCLNFHRALWPVNTGAAGVCDEKFSGSSGRQELSHTHLAGSSGSWVLCLCVKEL